MDSLPLELLSLGDRPSKVTVSTQTGQEDTAADDVEYINGKHPIRPGQPTCPYYGKKGGRCSFGRKCRYDHQPAAAQKQDRQPPPQQQQQRQQQQEQPGTAAAPAATGPTAERPAHDRQTMPMPPMDGALSQAAMRAWPWRAGRRSFLKGVLAAHIVETAYMQSMETSEVHYRLNTAQAGPVLQEAWRHQQGRSTEARQKPYSTLGKLLDGDLYLSIQEDPSKPGCNWVVLDVARLQADYGATAAAAAGSTVAMLGGVPVIGAAGAEPSMLAGRRGGAIAGAGSAPIGPPGMAAAGWMYRAASSAAGSRGFVPAAKGASSGSSSAYLAGVGSSAHASGGAGPSSSGYVLSGSGSSSSGMDSVHSHGGQMYPVGYGMAYGPAGGPYALGYGGAHVISMGGGGSHGPPASSGGYGQQQGRGSGSGMGLHPMHRGHSRG